MLGRMVREMTIDLADYQNCSFKSGKGIAFYVANLMQPND